MKKLLSVLLVGAMILASVGCSGGVSVGSLETINGDKVTSIEDASWDDFVVEIEGKVIPIGVVASKVEKMGFTFDSTFSVDEIGYDYPGVCYFSKERNLEDEDILSDTNPVLRVTHFEVGKDLAYKDCTVHGIYISDSCYSGYEVVLPGGIELTNDTKLEDLVKVWGDYTEVADRDDETSYKWRLDTGFMGEDREVFVDIDNSGHIVEFGIDYELDR